MNRKTLFLLALLSPSAALAAGNAVEFDGSGDYVSLGNLTPGSDFTVEFWICLLYTSPSPRDDR